MEFRAPKPIYKQIAEHILNQVLSGQWSSGQRIPSVREYASSIEVNPNTVARTYILLSEKDIIYTKRGVGYFLSEDAQEQAKKYLKEIFEKEEVPFLKKIIALLDINLDDYLSNR